MDATRPTPFGPYLLIERIGLGGTAEIFRAVRRGRRPGEPEVALKRLLPPYAEDPALARLFLREIGALSRIDHPGVVRLLDHGEDHGVPYLVTPLLDGCSLRDLLRAGSEPADDTRVHRTLPPCEALWIAARVAEGLAAAHRTGVVHRDVSPTNVQVLADGGVQVLDFGIARVAGLAQTTHGQGLRGKWPYLSPEQIAGGPLDGRSDLFALGSVLVEMLQGAPPFAADDRHETLSRIQAAHFAGIADLPPAIAAPLDALLRRLFAHDAAGRPADGDEVARELDRLTGLLLADEQGLPGAACQARVAVRVAEVPRRPVRPGFLSAEHRGEDVTDPALDPDATQVRG